MIWKSKTVPTPPTNVGEQKSNSVILPFHHINTFVEFAKNNKQLIAKVYLARLTIAINNDLEYIELFQYNDGRKKVRIKSKDYDRQLQSVIYHFVKSEDYESAARARDLLQKLKNKKSSTGS